MKKTAILFPNQLFIEHPILDECDEMYLVEEYLFFQQYQFHKTKLAFHRASMKAFAKEVQKKNGLNLVYVESTSETSDIRKLIPGIAEKPVKIFYINPTDNWLESRMKTAFQKHNVESFEYENPSFLNSWEDLQSFFMKDKKRFLQSSFYIEQRKKHHLLIDTNDNPEGGKWSFDKENRKRYPKNQSPPPINFPEKTIYWDEALKYVEENFRDHPGEVSLNPFYPINRRQSLEWLNQFLEFRFHEFGDYEDAILEQEMILNHSVLTPVLNIGLLSPNEVIEKSLSFAKENKVPINSLEGFVRQIIGWREFIRGVYESKGSYSRTKNFWGFKRKIPSSFYTGKTGITPLDKTIKKLLKTGYVHHIERLMVLGNFMLLCEFDPDEVYQWFMELFIDAYDWVMVPNIYGMSQFADGGVLATKPYISGSNYLLKMSDFKKGDWQKTWDGLFWRFMDQHRDFFLSNPRLSMLVRSFDKMTSEKKEEHLRNAEDFLEKL